MFAGLDPKRTTLREAQLWLAARERHAPDEQPPENAYQL